MQAELLAASGGSPILCEMWILQPEAAKSTSHTSQTLDADFAASGGKVCIQHTTLANCCRVPIYRARAARNQENKMSYTVTFFRNIYNLEML